MIAQLTKHSANRHCWTPIVETDPGCHCSCCANAQWIKIYTPWGCPDSVPCPQCTGKVGHCTADRVCPVSS